VRTHFVGLVAKHIQKVEVQNHVKAKSKFENLGVCNVLFAELSMKGMP
jgi:hypothetical protein